MTSVTFLFVGRYRSARNKKKLMWHSADFLHRASFAICEWGSRWFFLAGQRPETPAGSRVLKVGSTVPAPFGVETWGGTSNTHARQNYRFQRLSVPEIPLWGKQETRKSGHPVCCLFGCMKRNGLAMCFHRDSLNSDKLTPILIYFPIQAPWIEHFSASWFLNINKKTKLSFSIVMSATCKQDLKK